MTGKQEQGQTALDGPELELGDQGQIENTQEIKVDGEEASLLPRRPRPEQPPHCPA